MNPVTEIDNWYKSAYALRRDELGKDRLDYADMIDLSEEYKSRHRGLIEARERAIIIRETGERIEATPKGVCRICQGEIAPTGRRGRPPVICSPECGEQYYALKPDERKKLAYVQDLDRKGGHDPFVTVEGMLEEVLNKLELGQVEES